ncbi:MAG TPA: 2,3-bisphosphoglycerate-independent phosphoglycerate mutase [Bacilli bacterium]|nr:MAG: 2,3-bisphosphoglycerate-independent phosphoglycerate mutase [Tenericutes bacterium ADurb.BinA124]HPX83956.1 2,3-bisphosphoglycerate-independent phosphoglycerate mutase [Bacilli bacterium]
MSESSHKKPMMLVVMDGFGLSKTKVGNAIAAAKTPHLDYLLKNYPHTTLGASGEDVGLPEGQMGNSEVGHLNIGAGRIVYQSLTRLNIAVRNDELDKNPAINKALVQAKANNGKLHIMGLLSDGGVHSHINHILYLLTKAVQFGIKEVVVHAFLDGRDVPPQSATLYLKQLQDKINELGHSKIGVISGRYYAMDRDKNFDRLQLAYNALVYNDAMLKDVFQGINESYSQGITDEFVVPYVASVDSNIEDGDSVIFANFRPDRAIEISTSLTNPDLVPLKNKRQFSRFTFVSMMPYSENVKGEVAFDFQELDQSFGEIISSHGLTQLRIAETEKYAHVTYFFDGGEDKEIPLSTRVLIPSPKVATYDLMPEMSAYLVCDRVLQELDSQKYDVVVLNFANCDMVGHTTVFDATVKAVETVDECIGKIYAKITDLGGTLMIIADHGNAEKLVDELGKPFSAHTTNPVPCIITKKGLKLRQGGILADVAPTMLQLMNLPQPPVMTGKSIIESFEERK